MNLLLIDINSLSYAALHQPNLAKITHQGSPTGAINGAIVSLYAAMKLYPGAVPLILWDDRAEWRFQLLPPTDSHPGYKGDRDSTPEKRALVADHKRQSLVIREFLSGLGMIHLDAEGAEADDIMGLLSRGLPPDVGLHMVTRDTDWWQGLRPGASWYSPGTKVEKKFEDFSREAGSMTMDELLQVMAIAGDASDKIPGVEGIAEARALKMLRPHGSIEGFWEAVATGELEPKGVFQARLASQESKALYARNRLLMDWAQAPLLNTVSVSYGDPEPMTLDRLGREYGLSSLAKTGLSKYFVMGDVGAEVETMVRDAFETDCARRGKLAVSTNPPERAVEQAPAPKRTGFPQRARCRP